MHETRRLPARKVFHFPRNIVPVSSSARSEETVISPSPNDPNSFAKKLTVRNQNIVNPCFDRGAPIRAETTTKTIPMKLPSFFLALATFATLTPGTSHPLYGGNPEIFLTGDDSQGGGIVGAYTWRAGR
jgi:hypothetical protein